VDQAFACLWPFVSSFVLLPVVLAADLDGDGDSDVLFAAGYSAAGLLLNVGGSGSWPPALVPSQLPGTAAACGPLQLVALTVADLDLDGVSSPLAGSAAIAFRTSVVSAPSRVSAALPGARMRFTAVFFEFGPCCAAPTALLLCPGDLDVVAACGGLVLNANAGGVNMDLTFVYTILAPPQAAVQAVVVCDGPC
jgi:hypothetical protein